MRNYPKSRRTAKQRAERARAQEASLDAMLSEPTTPSQANLRGIGIVTPRARVRYSKPRYVRPNDSFIAANGARIATAEAGYVEFTRDVARTHKARTLKQATPTPQVVEPKRDLRSLALGDTAARFAD